MGNLYISYRFQVRKPLILIEDIVGIEIHTSYFMILNSKKLRNAPVLRIGSIEEGRPAQSI